MSEEQSAKRLVRVVAAIIRKEGRVLITQRRPQAFMPLKWEFPGGKVEAGESDQTALKRELQEELGIDASIGDEFMSLIHNYPDFDIDFHVYQCELLSKDIHSIGVNNFKWVSIDELDQFDFPPADQPTVKKLIK
jgi:8-oxo-dGTP diphosphatase